MAKQPLPTSNLPMLRDVAQPLYAGIFVCGIRLEVGDHFTPRKPAPRGYERKIRLDSGKNAINFDRLSNVLSFFFAANSVEFWSGGRFSDHFNKFSWITGHGDEGLKLGGDLFGIALGIAKLFAQDGDVDFGEDICAMNASCWSVIGSAYSDSI